MTRWLFAALALAGGIVAGWYVHPLIGVCVTLVLLPPSLDPAIRIKEWQVKRGWTRGG